MNDSRHRAKSNDIHPHRTHVHQLRMKQDNEFKEQNWSADYSKSEGQWLREQKKKKKSYSVK